MSPEPRAKQEPDASVKTTVFCAQQTLVRLAANDWFPPIVTDAAPEPNGFFGLNSVI